jgi:hypothetical protein
MLLIPWLTGCVKTPGSEEVSISADLPAMSRGCDPDSDDITNEDGDRVYGIIEPQGTNCRGIAYARVKALDWATGRT